jgi:hypothetical protein
LYVTNGFLVTHNTTVAVCTAPRPVGVILCEGDTALDYARVSMREDEGMSDKEIDKVLQYQKVDSWESITKAMADARAAAESGEIQTLVVDPLNFWADRLMDQCIKWTMTKDGNEDGRRAHPELTKRMRQIVYQLLALPCHVVVVSHYMDVGDAAKRGGPDKVPMLPNKEARAIVHGMFPHKLWMEMDQHGQRVFVMAPKGATGPGVRGYRGATEIPADIGELMTRLSIPGGKPGGKPADKTSSTAKTPPAKVVPIAGAKPSATPTPNRNPTNTPTRPATPSRPINNTTRR